jgi:integrase/recombinase XerC
LPLQKGRAAAPDEGTESGRRKKSPGAGATIRSILSLWRQGRSSNSTEVQTANALIQEIGSLYPRQLNAAIVENLWMRWRTRYAASTAYGRRHVLNSILRTLALSGAPAIKAPRMRKPEPRATICDPAKINQLFAAADTSMRLFILLCWHLALRFHEALAVTPLSWSESEQTVTIKTKGGKTRTIPVTPEVETLIRAATLQAGNPGESCVSILNGKPVSDGGIRAAWYRLVDAAGVRELRPHDLRRTTATNLYRITKDLRAVQQYLGHSSLASTTSYLAPLSTENLRGLHEQLRFLKPATEVKQ